MQTSSPLRRAHRAGLRAGILAGIAAVALVASLGGNVLAAEAQTQGGGFPVAGGMLQSRTGNTLSLSGSNGTSKVIVTTKTSYQETKATDATAAKVGSCVRVSGTGDATSGIGATTVAVQDASACKQSAQNQLPGGNGNRQLPGNGEFPGSGQFPGGEAPPNGSFPNGQAPTGGANGTFPGGAGGFGGGITGKVTAVDNTTLKVKGRVVSFPSTAGSSNNGSAARPKVKTRTVNVALTDSTAYTETVASSANSLTIGVCVNARGATDSVGTVTATAVTLSQPVDGACNAGQFGAGGPASGATST